MDENTSGVSLEEIQHWNVRALKDFLRIRGLKNGGHQRHAAHRPTHKYDYELALFISKKPSARQFGTCAVTMAKRLIAISLW